MKRSEMVQKIKNELPWMNTLFATAVLDVIEDNGMLPPSIADEGFLANIHKKHKDKHLIWEPEDETD